MNYNKNKNKFKAKIIPIVTYTNAEEYKSLILKENKNKLDIYRLNNLIIGKTYIGIY